ncbi:MAG: putative metal transporter, ATP-binding protein [Glaciihabitans sp.]|nr:putative metal transporter, ATP-binding protein [Glaciihabitans sp.]MCU1533625.1 putative metal transporter, ATP-binding protein [Glaciihabitans sp.]
MSQAVLSLRQASLGFGGRRLWQDLDLDVAPGEFLAVIGPNGTGKTSLLKTILGQQTLTSGTVSLLGHPVNGGNGEIGYIPQQKLIDQGTPLRARDLVTLGLSGKRWGLPFSSREERARVDETLARVGASDFARSPVSHLSGGEQQRLRVGQAVVGNPRLLLCDEPLLSLDLANQKAVSELINRQRIEFGAAVVFVTHDVNPILDMVDRVLYLAAGRFRIGTPDEVLRSEVLSEMYGTPVDVLRSRGRIVVVGAPDEAAPHDHHALGQREAS